MKFSILALMALAANSYAADPVTCPNFSGTYHVGALASACNETFVTTNPNLGKIITPGLGSALTLTPGFIDSDGVALRDDVNLKPDSYFTIEQRDCSSFTITYELNATGLDKPVEITQTVPLTGQPDKITWTLGELRARQSVEHHVTFPGNVKGDSQVNAMWSLAKDSGGDLIVSTSSLWKGHIGKDKGTVTDGESCRISKVDAMQEAIRLSHARIDNNYPVNDTAAVKLVNEGGEAAGFHAMQAELLRRHGFEHSMVVDVK